MVFIVFFINVKNLSTIKSHEIVNDSNNVSFLVNLKIEQLQGQSYIFHEPVNVSNDFELATVATSGSGTKLDPYVLQGWNITTNGVHGISIQHTSAHFIIRNCVIETGRIRHIYGIFINDTADNTAIITNNTCLNNDVGILVKYSTNVNITDNLCNQNSHNGIWLYYSKNCIVSSNICNENYWEGIWLVYSNYSTIANNICKSNIWGIHVHLGSSNNSIHRNLIEDSIRYAIHLSEGCNNNLIHHNIFLKNGYYESQAYDDGINNQWYNPATNKGNYWSDYSGKGNYQIRGNANTVDSYPLSTLPITTSTTVIKTSSQSYSTTEVKTTESTIEEGDSPGFEIIVVIIGLISLNILIFRLEFWKKSE